MVFKPKAYLTTCIWILIAIQFTAACVPQSGGSNARKSSKADATTSTTTKPTAPAPGFSSSSELYWFSGSKITGTITINQNIETVIYLRGSPLHNFLANSTYFAQTYCMVFGYSHSTARKQLRVRAIPITYNDFTTGTTERLLRLDLPNPSDNSAACAGPISTVSNSSYIAYSPETFCSSCFELITSTSMGLYLSSGGSISDTSLVPSTLLNTAGLALRIDTTSGSTSSESLCTNASCTTKGFDCCLNGQCVKDGMQKPNASSDPYYSQAQAEIATNPLNFINWPNLYYVCTNIPRIQATPTAYPNAIFTAQAAFDILVREYWCLEEGKKTSPNYANGTCSNTTSTSKSTCETGSGSGVWTYYCFGSGTGSGGLQSDHDRIRSNVWERCGCDADPFPASPDDPICPDFGLQATFDLQNKVTSVTCLIPQPVAIPTQFQELRLNVPARTAPHRFFKSSDGAAVDDVSTLKNISPAPTNEGAQFSYLDEAGKSGAENNGSFNMNAILGQLTVDLSRARPAIMVNVEYDQTYIISALKGNHTPCPMCAKDSWFTSFTAFPSSVQGRGLEAVGHTTSRDTYQTNITLGNYEDTIFGRACFVPPTMIAFSHMKRASGTVAAQRSARLSTQVAMFANGYQRDWYGFNRGAVIGSFNGVSWFAIGGGRRIQAKGNKLYLAINAPFADLTQPTDISVNITTDNGQNQAADFDFDPNLSNIDATNNSGASCQKYHQCETDGDCVSQLGWEYMCISTSALKTYTPKFDLDGNEQLDEKSGGITSILYNGTLPTGSKKRCVYRGMGAPCKTDFFTNNIYTPTTGSTIGNAKIFVCAPNFFCANLNETSVFNDQVIREPNDINNILYGKDTDILGRPKSYTSGGKTLTDIIKENLRHNFSLYATSTPANADWGLCMPGKSLAYNSWQQQQTGKDNSRRTDFISQIGSCNATASGGNTRARTCPSFDMREFLDGDKANANYKNYIITTSSGWGNSSSGTAYFTAVTPNDDDYIFRKNQNMCGKEAAKVDGTNTWKDIEYTSSPASVLLPGLAQNACLRRAGSLCHTDLDCAPNVLHYAQAKNFDRNYFGSGDPEHLFWKESLVCGQKNPIPFLNAADFSTYSLKDNRCCRSIGNDLTLFTSYTGTGTTSGSGALGDKFSTYFPSTAAAQAFNTGKLPSEGANVTGRYSRYASVPLGRMKADGITFETPNITTTLTGLRALSYQWKTINETARLTCCGGGAIRKFADGTHDWTIRDRLKIQPENFKCLNYRTEMAYDEDAAEAMTNLVEWREDNFRYCEFPRAPNQDAGGGCMQRALGDAANDFNIAAPKTLEGAGTWTFDRNDAATGGVDTISTSRHVLSVFPQSNPLGSGADKNTPPYRLDLPERVTAVSPFIPTYAEPFPTYSKFINYTISAAPQKIPWTLYMQGDSTVDVFEGVLFFYLPSYIGGSRNIIDMRVMYKGSGGQGFPTPACLASAIQTPPFPGGGDIVAALSGNVHFDAGCRDTIRMYKYNNRDVIAVHTRHGQAVAPYSTVAPMSHLAGVQITYNVAGMGTFEDNAGNTVSDYYGNSSIDPGDDGYMGSGLEGGNSNYYLSKLGRLELLGIPQIFYEPIICNAHSRKIVPDMFKDEINTTKSFFAAAVAQSYSDGTMKIYDPDATTTDSEGTQNRIVFQDKVKFPAIFSGEQFLCCKKLGETVTDQGQCCSGYALAPVVAPGAPAAPAGQMVCRLPRGTNLHVYFNRYVSTEGVGSGEPGGGLTDEDFIPETGEVAWNEESYDKITALGQAYCSDMTVRPGAAFGNFQGEPNLMMSINPPDATANPVSQNNRFSIIDSTRDRDAATGQSETGYGKFLSGYRWNHHLYCGPI
ncbi:MAG: hypothetical protein HYV97_11140 [Bdellovibrio sp.]|nr:hypothetical protein [Bdellovibrio sp.]